MKKFITFILVLCMSSACLAKWPTKDITLVVPYPAGGFNDILARMAQEELTEKFKVGVHVKNMPGAANMVAVNHVLNMTNDHHTFLFTDSELIAGSVFQGTNHHTQFVPVVIAGYNPLVLFGNSSSTLTRVKAQNQASVMVNVGVNMPGQLWLEGIKSNIQYNIVPYRGTPLLITDVAGGQIEYGVLSIAAITSMVKDNRLVPFVIASDKRNPALPEVPTYKELGWSGDVGINWYGAFARKDTDPEAVNTITTTIRSLLSKHPRIKDFNSQGFVSMNTDAKSSAIFITQEVVKFERIKKSKGQ